jgi:O-antigen/teichoic acid export membrane protein
MLFTVTFFLNAAANFAFGLTLSALLGPAEFGRYSTVQLASITLATGMLDWLRYSTLRYSGDDRARTVIASSLETGYVALTLAAYLVVGLLAAFGVTFNFGAIMLLLTPLLGVAAHRVDYSGAKFRAREQGARFAAIYGLRQALCFSAVLLVAWRTRDAVSVVAALAAANLIPAIVLGGWSRSESATLRNASMARLAQFFVYAKPIVVSLVIYQLIGLINRYVALASLGPAAAGKLSLAADLGQRLFGAVNSLPELMLFQYALRLDRTEGRAAADRQLAVNMALVFALLAPFTVGYAVMAPTFEALLVPAAYRGDFARLSFEHAPGFFALFATIAGVNPIFQLRNKTWLVTLAALSALATDLVLLNFTSLGGSVDGLAIAYSASLVVSLLVTLVVGFSIWSVRPRLRDFVVIAAATGIMAALVRPLNGLPSHALAAALAVAIGTVLLGGAGLVFDVAGVRSLAIVAYRNRSFSAWGGGLGRSDGRMGSGAGEC